MVNENLIPKTEMVYELKSEIPSYEEFANNYEYDGNVVNAYHLENQDQEKGYGPCYRTNPDCKCYVNQSPAWIQLYVGCLAEGCPNHKEPFSWVHRACDYPIYISTDLQLKCVMCDKPSHMSNWRFNCQQPRHPGDWENKTTSASFNNALSYMNARISNRVPEVRTKTREIVIKMLDEQGW